MGSKLRTPQAISLFSGVGGGDLGMARAGILPMLQVELDVRARAVLEARWPNVRRLQDVQDVATITSDVEDWSDALVIHGGFPCQDISAGRDRWGAEGLIGARSRLWWEFHRIVSVLRPKWTVVENVERLRNGRNGADLRAIVGGLNDLDYVGFGVVLDAAAFNLPARRPRIYIVARRAEGTIGGLEQGQGMATRWARHDPGCVVLERPRQSRTADNGSTRPVRGTYRKLTALEMERALGWPDDHTAVEYKGRRLSESYRQHLVGDGMAAPVMEAIGRFILLEEAR